jgi:hypothetical protein
MPRWTKEEDAVLRVDYPGRRTTDVAEDLGRTVCSVFNRAHKLGLKKSAEFNVSELSGRPLRGKHDLRGANARFQKGTAPWNRGIKGSCGNHPNCRATQFKKGVLQGTAAARVQPIGALRVAEGVLQQKVNNDRPFHRRWRSVHSLVWEAARGPIPDGHKVVFLPGRHTTVLEQITAETLELVSHAELMRRNSYHTRYPAEVGRLIQMKGQLNRRINRRAEELHEK